MDGVERVVQRAGRTLDWTDEIGGRRTAWTAVITDQTPATRIAWKLVSTMEGAGSRAARPLSERTRSS